ncbi:MAG TPA: polyhydroxyalkanoic acid system family protein [Thermoanaerobaculia bacterium]
MRIAVPHNTSKNVARGKLDQRLGQLLSQFGGHAEEIEHEWLGDTMRFRGKARGMAVEGTVEVTDAAIILDAKLPLLAKMFEGRIREAVQREADSMFRIA